MKYWISFLLVIVSSSGLTKKKHDFDSTHLSSEARQLLIEEMTGIKTAMQQLVVPLVTGDWKTINELSKNIEASFVFKKKLTPEIKQELVSTLPEGFKFLDGQFHQYAGSLAHAAKQKKKEEVNFYYYKMLDTCQSCHARYAKQRFSNLSHSKQSEHAH